MLHEEFFTGASFDAHAYFGAHPAAGGGFQFRVFAPGARSVEVIGEWNAWEGEAMTRDTAGIWSAVCPTAEAGQLYKFRVAQPDGRVLDKADPYAFSSEMRPQTASRLVGTSEFRFTDGEWIRKRSLGYDEPVSIYELHLGSWRRTPDGDFLTYEELAELLPAYLRENNFTHAELLPVMEHPLDASWGYQLSGYFSVTSRYGTPDGLRKLVNALHEAGIGVIFDFVPAHFVGNDYALANFDGTQLYEYPASDVTYSEWGSCNFNFYRGEVRSFLQSSAAYWIGEFHADGLRVDAVPNVLYWQGQPERGVNIGAVDFLKKMNAGLKRLFGNVLLIAEDSSNFPKVTAPVEYGGLGFDYKWDMGWMNEVLDYMKKRPDERGQFAQEILHPMEYFYSDIFLLPLSHDEVVHGKGTLWGKIYGTPDEKMRQLRAFWLYFFTTPGKKLSFMGNELASRREWDEKAAHEWELLSETAHEGFYRLNGALSALYGAHPALYKNDYNAESFSWMDTSRAGQAVFAYCRDSLDAEAPERLYTALNFSNRPVPGYEMPVRRLGMYEVLLHTEEPSFGGAGGFTQPVPAHLVRGKPCIRFDLPAMSGVLFREKSAQI